MPGSAADPVALDPFQRIVEVHWRSARKHRLFIKMYVTVGWSTINVQTHTGIYDGDIGGTDGPGLSDILLPASTLSAGSDADTAASQVAGIIENAALTFPGVTLVNISGILEGPEQIAGTFAMSWQYWLWRGTGYDAVGNKISAIRDSSYVIDADQFLYGYVGGSEQLGTDPGPPPI